MPKKIRNSFGKNDFVKKDTDFIDVDAIKNYVEKEQQIEKRIQEETK